MIVVIGTFDVDPSQRKAFIEARADQVAQARARAGNADYVLSLDALDPGRVRLLEVWESEDAFAEHLQAIAAGGGPPSGVEVISRTIRVIDGQQRG